MGPELEGLKIEKKQTFIDFSLGQGLTAQDKNLVVLQATTTHIFGIIHVWM